MELVNLFYDLSRQHKNVAAFMYNRGTKKGAGNEAHPLVWLDDPILGRVVNNAIVFSVNIDFLDVPKEDNQVAAIQGGALATALEMIEQIKVLRRKGAAYSYGIESADIITLRDYYDNKAAGVRLSLELSKANPVDLCADNFDPTKEFVITEALPDFSTENPDGCAVFGGKGLPTFDV